MDFRNVETLSKGEKSAVQHLEHIFDLNERKLSL